MLTPKVTHSPTNTKVQSLATHVSGVMRREPSRTTRAEENMSKEVNLQTLSKFAEAVNTGKFELFKEAVSSENIDHDPASGQVPGPEGYRAFFGGLREAFPGSECGVGNLGCG